MKINKKFGQKVKMIAHRGLSGVEQENTAAAFIAAGNRSYFGIECDIHITKDNVFVICHDAHTARISPVSYVIKEVSYKELAGVFLFDRASEETKSYLTILTLKEYLAIASKYQKHSFIEIKPEFTMKEIEQFLFEISKYGSLDMITVISFNYSNLKRIHKLNSSLRLQYLLERPSDVAIELCRNIAADADIFYQNVTKSDIVRLHKNNIKVNVWTIDNPVVAKNFIRWGADYITTNILE